MSMNKIAIVGAEAAAKNLQKLGVELVTSKTTPRAVAQEVSLLSRGEYVVVVVTPLDARIELWIANQVAAGVRVAILETDDESNSNIKGTRSLPSTSTVNDLLALFKMKNVTGGDINILDDGFNPFEDVEDTEEAEAQVVESEPVDVVPTTPPTRRRPVNDEQEPPPVFAPPPIEEPPPVFAPPPIEEPPPVFAPPPIEEPPPVFAPPPVSDLAHDAARKLVDRNAGILDSDTIAPIFGVIPQPRRTKVIVCFSGKGGTGKTTTSVLLAHIASALGGIERVVLLDANRGQGDVRTYLGLKATNVPSVYDMVFNGGRVQDIMISPDQMKAAIGSSAIRFYTVLAPRIEDADPEVVSNSIYTQAIQQLMSNVDLLVIDTQTSELVDIPAIMTKVMIPILIGNPDAYALGIPDSSIAGINNTQSIARSMINGGVKAEQIFFIFNRMAIGADVLQLQNQMRGLGKVIAAVQADQNVTTRPSLVNGVDLRSPYAHALMDMLYTATQNDKFVFHVDDSSRAQSAHRLLSFFKKSS